MKTHNIDEFPTGWFAGFFRDEPHLKTNAFEFGWKSYKKGDVHSYHTHKIATEYSIVTRGRIRINGVELGAGGIFVMEPYDVTDIEFLTDCDIAIVKAPSVPGDKYITDIDGNEV